MEQCPTCGAAVRPGAKFCTSCGSRLEEPKTQAPTDESWQKPSDTQETSIVAPTSADKGVTPEPNWDAATGNAITEEQPETAEPTSDEEPATDQADRWSSNWPTPATELTDDSPADRFQEALDSETAATTSWAWGAPESNEDSGATASSTWTPPPESEKDEAESSFESGTISPEKETVTDIVAPSRPDQTDSLRDGEISSPIDDTPDSDARQHASALLDEVRRLVWKIGLTDTSVSASKNTIQNMSHVRGETSDFADLEPTISAVQENPRDIDALRDLGRKADRLHDLLESHRRLIATLEDAISDR